MDVLGKESYLKRIDTNEPEKLKESLEEPEVSGLDADGSSLSSIKNKYNDDNDVISGNPDGENDINVKKKGYMPSRLDDK